MTEKQFNDIKDWQNKTFKKATAISKLNHLTLEVKELASELIKRNHGIPNNEALLFELADCQILIAGIIDKSGFDYQDICKAIEDKMEKNKKRQWEKPNEHGIYFHKK